MPNEENQNNDKCKRAESGAHRDSRRRVGIAASIRAIPNLADSDEDEDEWPVGPENWPRIESWTPVVQEKKNPDRNEDNGEDEGNSSGTTVLGHGRPPLPCTTRAEGKSVSERLATLYNNAGTGKNWESRLEASSTNSQAKAWPPHGIG